MTLRKRINVQSRLSSKWEVAWRHFIVKQEKLQHDAKFSSGKVKINIFTQIKALIIIWTTNLETKGSVNWRKRQNFVWMLKRALDWSVLNSGYLIWRRNVDCWRQTDWRRKLCYRIIKGSNSLDYERIWSRLSENVWTLRHCFQATCTFESLSQRENKMI